MTAPLSQHALTALRLLSVAPRPRQTFNSGVVDKLTREGLADLGMLPSPFQGHKGQRIQHLVITEAGKRALAAGV